MRLLLHVPRSLMLFSVVLASAAGPLHLVPPSAQAQPDGEELRAREAFAAGRYQEAVDLFARLYARTLHPTYLRNIGRAYQNMEVPDKAIASFRDYLRKASDLNAGERAEIEGYIKEMEALQARQSARRDAPPPSPQTVPTTPRQPEPEGNPVLVTGGTSEVQDEPLYRKTWFWLTVAGAVAIVTVAGLAAGGAFSAADDPACPQGYDECR